MMLYPWQTMLVIVGLPEWVSVEDKQGWYQAFKEDLDK